MSLHVVVNPASANGRTGRRWAEIAAALRRAMGDFEVSFTEAPGDATTLARAALEAGAERVLSVGGDGTHNEVVNGFFDSDGRTTHPDVILGIVPTGTGGDLRRTLGLPKAAVEAIDALGASDHIVEADAGRVRFIDHDGREASRCFINIGSFGMGGLVDQYVNGSSKALGAKASFLMGVVRATVKWRNTRVRISYDGGPAVERVIQNVAIANARYFGGGMMVAPQADPCDGRFDVVVIGEMSLPDQALGLKRMYDGEHLGLAGVEHCHAREVHAECARAEDTVLIDVDGEQPGRLPATYSLLPSVIRLWVPRAYAASPAA